MEDRRHCAARARLLENFGYGQFGYLFSVVSADFYVLSHSFNFWIAEAIDKMVVNDAVGLHQRIARWVPQIAISCFGALLICSDSLLLTCICFVVGLVAFLWVRRTREVSQRSVLFDGR